MQTNVSVAQLGQHDLVSMSNSLEELLVNISPDTLAHVPDTHQERIQSWIDGNRLMPRLLIPYLGDEFLINDFEPRDIPFVAEELADACKLAGMIQPDISGLADEQVEVLLNWIDTVHMQSHLAFRSGNQPVFTLYPADRLGVASPVVPEDEPSEVRNPFAEPEVADVELVQSVPGNDDITGESAFQPPEWTHSNSGLDLADDSESVSYENETREEAKLRLQEEMHYAKEALITLTGEHEVAKEDAKFAKARMAQAQIRLNDVVQELDEVIRDGDWQPRLPLDRCSDSVSPVAKDPALTAAIHELVKFGATEKQCDKLVDAQIETVKEFEDRLSSGNPITKVKGIGQSAADTFADALVGWRAANGYGENSEIEA